MTTNNEVSNPIEKVGDAARRWPTLDEIAVQARMTSSEHLDKLGDALAKAQGDFKPINKDGKADIRGKSKSGKDYQMSYKYATLAHVREAVKDGLAANGLSITQPIVPSPIGNGWALETRLLHLSGQFQRSWIPIPMGGSPQELGSLLTYFRRYQLTTVLGVAADEDEDGALAEERYNARQQQARPAQQYRAPSPQPAQQAPPRAKNPDAKVTQNQLKRFYALAGIAAKEGRWSKAEIDDTLQTIVKVESASHLTNRAYDWMCNVVEKSSFKVVLDKWQAKLEQEAEAQTAASTPEPNASKPAEPQAPQGQAQPKAHVPQDQPTPPQGDPDPNPEPAGPTDDDAPEESEFERTRSTLSDMHDEDDPTDYDGGAEQ